MVFTQGTIQCGQWATGHSFHAQEPWLERSHHEWKRLTSITWIILAFCQEPVKIAMVEANLVELSIS